MARLRVVTVHQAKTHLSRLLVEVEGGREIVIRRGRTPIAKIVPFRAARTQCRIAGYEGRIVMAPDFGAPLDDFAGYR